MRFEEVDKKNVKIAIQIQREIFPLENGSEDLKDSVNNTIPNHQFLHKYWLAKVDNQYVGITGLYAYNDYPLDAWLAWFGVLEQYRGNGYASEIIDFSLKKAKELGFNVLRLYTDEEDNATAIKLYEKIGMTSEIYDNPDDLHFEISKTLIYSKSLIGNTPPPWNNKNLYLNAHDERNEE